MLIRAIEFSIKAAQYAIGIGSGSRVFMGESASMKRLPPNAVIFDVGANVGQFATLVRSTMKGEYRLYCFEPAKAAYEALARNIRNAELLNIALADKPGSLTLHYEKLCSGAASLTKRRMDHFGTPFNLSEAVQVDTIDRVCERLGIDRIDLLKIDVEGHELDVLRGAAGMFQRRAIKSVQFEFGGCNIDTRTFLQDFFYFFKQHRMRIHRITPFGYLQPLTAYREIDEQFRTTNFLAISAHDAPS